MGLSERLKVAHRLYDQLSINAQFAANDPENDIVFFVAEVTTPKGTFTGLGVSDKGLDSTMADLVRTTREAAIEEALVLAGVPEEMPELPMGHVPARIGRVVPGPYTATPHATTTTTATNCANCGQLITDHVSGTDIVPADEVARKTTKRRGAPLCAECSQNMVRTR